ncbi:MAG: KEOPS complex subunit Pcc1 [Candidatus Caldarchaeum sp.]|nr:KEOPS complex subunit Pcc1 [Candidatus Caldarchaeum sp.]
MVFEDEAKASVVYGSIKPDDKPLPPGLMVETRLDGATVVVEVECSRGFASFLATLDDILSSASLSEKVSKALAGKDDKYIETR